MTDALLLQAMCDRKVGVKTKRFNVYSCFNTPLVKDKIPLSLYNHNAAGALHNLPRILAEQVEMSVFSHLSIRLAAKISVDNHFFKRRPKDADPLSKSQWDTNSLLQSFLHRSFSPDENNKQINRKCFCS